MSFRQGPWCQVLQCQIKTNKHDSENLILSKYYLYDAPQTKSLKNKSVLDMEFAKW